MEPVIEVINLSKRYRIGLAEKQSNTFMGQMASVLISPLLNFKKLRSLSKFHAKDDESVFWALNNIDFEVREGEVVGVIGHNGAGKSTLLKILSRITEPTTGEIRIYGRVSSLLEVGTGFHPDLTGRENIYMNGTILGMRKKEIDGKFQEIVEFSGVSKYIDTPVKRYSSGMKVRLAFSVAAHLEPDILIIDEVLAVGDAEFQARCLGKMKDVASRGRTVLFVSHNLAAVRSLCQRGIVLKNGKKIFDGSQLDAIDVYRKNTFNNFAYDFIRTESSKKEVVKRIYLDCPDQDNSNINENAISIGSEITIVIELDSEKNVFRNCNLSLGIFSNDDLLIVAFKSRVQFNRRWDLEGKRNVRILWKNIDVIPGDYYLKCSFGGEEGIIDDLSFAGRIKVILDRDIYDSGNSTKQNQGYIVPFVKWSL